MAFKLLLKMYKYPATSASFLIYVYTYILYTSHPASDLTIFHISLRIFYEIKQMNELMSRYCLISRITIFKTYPWLNKIIYLYLDKAQVVRVEHNLRKAA